MEFSRDEVNDGDHLGFAAVAAGSGLRGLDEGIRALQQSVTDPTVVPADDSVPMRFDEFDEILVGCSRLRFAP